jgi:hypothetical protein
LLGGAVVLVHEVVVVAEVVLGNVDAAEGVGDGLLRGGLEVGQEGLEGGCAAVSALCTSFLFFFFFLFIFFYLPFVCPWLHSLNCTW